MKNKTTVAEHMANELFEIEAKAVTDPLRKCKHCKFSERWKCGSKRIWYCETRKSSLTNNGLLKIKANDPACGLFKI